MSRSARTAARDTDPEASMLCVGGPCAGQRADPRGQRYLDMRVTVGLLPTARYERMAWHANGHLVWLLVPEGTPGDNTLRELVGGYVPTQFFPPSLGTAPPARERKSAT